MVDLQKKAILSGLVVFSALLAVQGCKDGLMDGKCGLQGQRVECILDFDCRDESEYCNLHGECVFRGDPLRCPEGGYGVGLECEWSGGLVCGDDLECHAPCNSHDECLPGDTCTCFAPAVFAPDTLSGGWCHTTRCTGSGTCPVDFEIVEGLLSCWPSVKEGDCRRISNVPDCPPGYEPEGNHGCRVVLPFAWKDADAGVLDAGVP